MKWQTVTTGINHSAYALWNNGRKLVTLVFNPSSSAARVEYAGEKRVFLVRKEGFLKNKTVLRNEYGVHICHTGSENNEEFIEMDNERYYYSVETNDEPAVTIYKESKDHPLAFCELDVDQKDMIIDLSGENKSLKDDAKYSLLMMLCWYLFKSVKPVKKEEQLELA